MPTLGSNDAIAARDTTSGHPRGIQILTCSQQAPLSEADLATASFSCLNFGDATWMPLTLVPGRRGTFHEQAQKVLWALHRFAETQSAALLSQTVFLRDVRKRGEWERLFARWFGTQPTVTNFVAQPPCCGASLAIEAWVINGNGTSVKRHGPHARSAAHDGVRWIHSGQISPVDRSGRLYPRAVETFGRARNVLERANSRFEHVVRTWLYVGGITENDGRQSRYEELNRARTDFFQDVHFGTSLPVHNGTHKVYPASTGIGTRGSGVTMSCLAMETAREDVFLLPLENPQQTSAYTYAPRYSPQSPKFSRGMAIILGEKVITWISGTASIVNSESCHVEDIEAQTEQTIDNIARLIAPDNFAAHGLNQAGAGLEDLASIRVYLKRQADFPKCRAICERRFGRVPAIYVTADICRPELLVEIEGVAFSQRVP